MNKINIVSFSGGKDSTAMLLMMLERGVKVDRVINVDTTKEFPQMYEHIRKVERYIGLKIETVKIDFDYWFSEHIKIKGKNKGEKGYGWPDFRNRWCTALKRKAFFHALYDEGCSLRKKGIEVNEFHGIAADEKERTLKNQGGSRRIFYPLVDWGITEAEALRYCYDKGFDWGGLYEDGRSRVSCYCCPLQRIGELKLTYQKHPELWANMEAMDKHSFRKFRSDYSLYELKQRFGKEYRG